MNDFRVKLDPVESPLPVLHGGQQERFGVTPVISNPDGRRVI